MENSLIGLIRDTLHGLGFHNWYYGKYQERRACVRCGIIQKRGQLTGKWINER